jgi:DegV family protein with EDD domain
LKDVYEIVTDSTCDLPKKLIEQYGIKVVPLWVKFGEKLYRDGVDIESCEFYEKLRNEKEFPKTSQPSPKDFSEVYRKSKKIISIHISSEMSGTYNAALLARDMTPGVEVEVIDSRLTSIALGLVVLEAARVAKTTNSKEKILYHLNRLIPKVRTLFTVSTLEFLHKGGRIGGARKFFGEMLGIKPILGIEGGKIVPVTKVRGKEQLLDKIIELMRRDVKNEERIKIGVVHAGRLDLGEKVKERLQNTFNCSELIMSTIGSIIGAHVGPGAWGVAYYKVED